MENPLIRPTPKEIPLKSAPLVKVIAQLRFPIIASIENQGFIGSFQESIREDYPILRPELEVSPRMPLGNFSSKIWRFIDEKKDWIVSLAQNFIAIETSHYTNRRDFLKRWEQVFTAATEYLRLKQYDRLGVRYIDRIEDGAVKDIKKFIRPEALGIMNDFSEDQISRTFNEILFKMKDSQLLARWGKLAANSTFDPGAIEPKPKESWVLDLDMFRNTSEQLEVEKIIEESEFYTERIYSFFRWVVTDNFLKYYGGKL